MELLGDRLALTATPTRLALTSGLPAVPTSADHGHNLDADTVRRVWAAVEASTSASTKAAYRSDWARFERWCAAGGHVVLPASPMVVAAYLTEAAGERKADGRAAFGAASLTRWASSINQVHTAAGHPAPSRLEVVRRALSECDGLVRRRRNAAARCCWPTSAGCWRRWVRR